MAIDLQGAAPTAPWRDAVDYDPTFAAGRLPPCALDLPLVSAATSLPFFKHAQNRYEHISAGWQANDIMTLMSVTPFDVYDFAAR